MDTREAGNTARRGTGKIALAYSQAWQEAFDTEPVSFRKDNAARRTANRRLREFCTRYTPAVQGYTSLPPRV